MHIDILITRIKLQRQSADPNINQPALVRDCREVLEHRSHVRQG
jgi:hypothetical protein